MGEYEFILNLQDDILDFLPGEHDENLDRDPVIEDIDMTKCYKFYIDADLYADPDITDQELKDMTAKAKYIWQVPVYIDDATAIVTLNRIYDTENEWKAVSASIYPERIDYFEIVDRALKREGLPLTDYVLQFFGGCPGNATPSALVSYSEDERYLIPLKDSFGVTVNEESQANINIEKGKAYHFEEYAPNFMITEKEIKGTDEEIYEIGMEGDDIQYTYKTVSRKDYDVYIAISFVVLLLAIIFVAKKKDM